MQNHHCAEYTEGRVDTQPLPCLASGTATFVCADLASSFLPCTDTFPAAAVPAAAGFDVLAGSTLGTSALTAVAAVAL